MQQVYQFTEETKILIADSEKQFKKERRKQRKVTKEQLEFIDVLIARFDEAFPGYYDRRFCQEICIYGQEYLIMPEMAREVKEIVKAINKNAFDNKAVYKRFEENGQYRRKKTFKPYRIQRLARMLKIAKEVNTTLFENFIKIPDVCYTLDVIKSNQFGELDVYMGVKSR